MLVRKKGQAASSGHDQQSWLLIARDGREGQHYTVISGQDGDLKPSRIGSIMLHIFDLGK